MLYFCRNDNQIKNNFGENGFFLLKKFYSKKKFFYKKKDI